MRPLPPVLVGLALLALAGCASDSTIRGSFFTIQHKQRTPAPCSSVPAPETNTGLLFPQGGATAPLSPLANESEVLEGARSTP